GIGGGDAAEVEGAVDNRHEEVGGGYHPPPVIQGIDRRIVARGIAYPQPRIAVLRPTAGEDGFQYLGGNLAATAGSMAVLRQADRLAHRHSRQKKVRPQILAKLRFALTLRIIAALFHQSAAAVVRPPTTEFFPPLNRRTFHAQTYPRTDQRPG